MALTPGGSARLDFNAVGNSFGPMIFTPQSNLGPLLGILITGPLGFVSGIWFGTLYGLIRLQVPHPGPSP